MHFHTEELNFRLVLLSYVAYLKLALNSPKIALTFTLNVPTNDQNFLKYTKVGLEQSNSFLLSIWDKFFSSSKIFWIIRKVVHEKTNVTHPRNNMDSKKIWNAP